MTNPPPIDYHVVHTAGDLFQTQGYSHTTLEQIADVSGCDEQAILTHFGSKAHVALALYRRLNSDKAMLRTLSPVGTIASRYRDVLSAKIEQLSPYEAAIAGVFSSAMHTDADITPTQICEGVRDPAVLTYAELVRGSIDAPHKEQDIQQIALMLYSLQMLLVLFWLYDRTPQKQATAHLSDYLGDLVKMARPMLMMPPVRKAMLKLSQIMLLVFGGAELTP